MRVWLYDTLNTAPGLVTPSGDRVVVRPRQATNVVPPGDQFIIYGMGNDSNEQLADGVDHIAHRQFFQVWVHDKSGDYALIDDLVKVVKAALTGKTSKANNITNILWLETSQEFENQTYNTLFRYIRFQAIISKGAPA